MTSDALAAPASTASRRRSIHLLTGVVPLGLFLLEYLWTGSHALYGRSAFNHAIGALQARPFVALELLCIALPLLLHAFAGLVIADETSANVMRFPSTGNWLALLQRVTGPISFLFVALYLWQFRVREALHAFPWPNLYYQLTVALNRPAWFAISVTGATASVFHFAHGLWRFGNHAGLTAGERSQRRSAWVCGITGLLLWTLGVNVLLHFAFRCGGVIPLPGVGSACGR